MKRDARTIVYSRRPLPTCGKQAGAAGMRALALIVWAGWILCGRLDAAPGSGAGPRFKKIVIDRTFRSEGVAVGDVNHDGKTDIFAGDVWYEAPGWKMHEIRPAGKYKPAGGYSNCFANFAQDVNGDGWIDSIVIGLPSDPCYWYENPRGKPGHWKRRTVCKSACNETPLFADLLGDGKAVPVFPSAGKMAWFSIPKDLEGPWDMHAVSGPKAPGTQKYAHGLGVGDVNGDGRRDILVTDGWWEAPNDRKQPNWRFHKTRLGPKCADMIVYDVDGDGDGDVITSSAHAYGIWWFEQVRTDAGVTFKQHDIFKQFSQPHALILADVNNDGLKDLVTGKRYFAHHGRDPGGREPAVLYWLELRRPTKGAPEFLPHRIDDDSGVGTQFQVSDLDGDGKLDIITSNKKGVHVFLQEAKEGLGGVDFDRIKAVPIFDGKTFAGWEGDLKTFRIEDGAIVGGTLGKRIPRNEFLCTKRQYSDFELRLKAKLIGRGANAGIQIRSRRIPNHHEVIGYQADMGRGIWGVLYDESRRRRKLASANNQELAKVLPPGGWNEYVIRCVGKRIQLRVNGYQTVDYIEPDDKIKQTGIIGLQIHGGAPSEAWYKDITIKEIPPKR